MRVCTVFGTRPEAIKMAPVVQILHQDERFEQTVVVTAQHRQMLDQVLDLFGIAPDIDFDLMEPGQTLARLTGRVLEPLTEHFLEHAPDLVLVHGDTTTAFATAVAAYYARVPVGHVEAGLRTGDKLAPWPEEMNRQWIGRVAELHFAPTPRAADNLRREAVAEEQIHVTGNTVIDALHTVRARLDEAQRTDRLDLHALLSSNAANTSPPPATLSALQAVARGERRLVLVTGHRRENFGDGFDRICSALRTLAQRYPDVHWVYPVHLNPAVREPVHRSLGDLPNLHLLPPLDYLPFVHLMALAHVVLTDSGGIQEEAPGLGRPVVVMRDTTERPEAVEAGTVVLAGTDTGRIVHHISTLLDNAEAWSRMSRAHNPYGDGQAAPRIRDAIVDWGARTRP